MKTAHRRQAATGEYLRGVIYRRLAPALGEAPVPTIVPGDSAAEVTVTVLDGAGQRTPT